VKSQHEGVVLNTSLHDIQFRHFPPDSSYLLPLPLYPSVTLDQLKFYRMYKQMLDWKLIDLHSISCQPMLPLVNSASVVANHWITTLNLKF